MKKILVIGATGLLGGAVVKAMEKVGEVIESSKSSKTNPVDISQVSSLKELFTKVGQVDAIICTAGLVNFKGFTEASEQDWNFGLSNKLLGQVNVVRFGSPFVNQGGSIILTTGILSSYPMPGSSIVTTVNAAVDGFVKSAAIELQGKVRVNAVSPGWISETLVAMGMDTAPGMPVSEIAQAYVNLVDSNETGTICIAAKG